MAAGGGVVSYAVAVVSASAVKRGRGIFEVNNSDVAGISVRAPLHARFTNSQSCAKLLQITSLASHTQTVPKPQKAEYLPPEMGVGGVTGNQKVA